MEKINNNVKIIFMKIILSFYSKDKVLFKTKYFNINTYRLFSVIYKLNEYICNIYNKQE